MLEIKNLGVKSGKKQIIENINFHLEKGKFTAVIGLNGSGKSTLVSAINGLVKYSGEIVLCGEDIKKIPLRKRSSLLSIMPQKLPRTDLSVLELAQMGRNPYIPIGAQMSETDKKIALDAVEKADLKDFYSRSANSLSGGEGQRAFLAMNLAQNAQIMILDEPTAQMDALSEQKFLLLLSSLKNEGKTIMVVMHNLSSAVEFADNILVLDKGKSVFFGTRQEALEKEVIEKNFGLKKYEIDGKIFFKA